MLSAEVSLYPLKTKDATSIIEDSIKALEGVELEYRVGSISTFLNGKSDEVWAGLRVLFEKADAAGETNMVVTLSNSAD